MTKVKHTLATNTTVAQPGQLFTGKKGESVEWPEVVISAVKRQEAKLKGKEGEAVNIAGRLGPRSTKKRAKSQA
ncbi:MAG: hypothetical protein AAGH88_11175 [Planctomycetota bacterium]